MYEHLLLVLQPADENRIAVEEALRGRLRACVSNKMRTATDPIST